MILARSNVPRDRPVVDTCPPINAGAIVVPSTQAIGLEVTRATEPFVLAILTVADKVADQRAVNELAVLAVELAWWRGRALTWPWVQADVVER